MSNRTVVSVEPRGDDTVEIKLAKSPGAIAGARNPHPFDCRPDAMPQWSEADAIARHGRTIFDKLNAHVAIKTALGDLQRIQPPATRSLYFHLIANEAERLSWETLCDPTGRFLALDRRWPIARMADSEVDQRLQTGDFVAPLKVMALLSAIHRPALQEWQGLFEAVKRARARGFEIELVVMVGEETLLAAIEAEKAGGPLPWLTVQPIPDRVVALGLALAEHRPHVLHFYCHGSTGSGVAQVQLATIPDWDNDKTTGSLVVKLEELSGFPALEATWLITLNCCEGGKAQSDLHSMAHTLVAGGVPAAIGMSEPIDAADAHEFASVFYPELLSQLQAALERSRDANTSVEFEWAPALHSPRTALRDRHGDALQHRVWTLPVLYVRPEPFGLRFVAPVAPGVTLDPETQTRVMAIAGALRAMPPRTPEAARQGLLDLLADVPVAFRPALDGSLAADF
jgi:hypothetical protein